MKLASRNGHDLTWKACRSVAVSTPSTTTAATTPVTAISAAAPAAFHLGTRLVDVQSAAAELGAIQGGNGFVSLLGVGHLHKSEPARTAGVPVGHDADAVYLSVYLEHLAQFFFRSVEVEVPNENVLQANRLELSYLRVTDFGEK
jgi:hypothetical protein